MIRFLQSSSRAKKVLLGSVIGIVALTMVITLIPGITRDSMGANSDVIARVDGENITVAEVQRTANSLMQRQFGGRAMPQFQPFFMQRAADMLINERVLLAEASRLGLRVTDLEFADEMRRNFGEQLFPDGKMVTRQQYEGFVAQMSQQIGIPMNVPQFEELYRQQLLINKLRAFIADSVTVPDEHVRKEYENRNTEVKLEYAMVTADDLMKQVKAGDAELKAYFDANQPRYQNAIPEKRKLRYVALDPARMQEKIEVTREDLQRFYDEPDRKEQFRVTEQVKVRHILIRTPEPGPDGKTDDKAVQEARAKAEGVLKQLRGGADFAQLAKKDSEDETAGEGGDLGWIQRGQTQAEFDKAAFETPKGEISGVVQTSFGFHLVKVDDKQPARLKPLDEVANVIRNAVRQEKAQREIEAQVNAVLTRARSIGLDKAAGEQGLQVVSTDFVERTAALPGLGPAPQLMEAAFAVKPKDPPELARMPTHYAIFEVTDVQPARTPAFEEFKARIENDFKNERASRLLPQKLSELSDRARALNNLRAAAKELGLTIKSTDWVRAGGQAPDIGAAPAAAFRMQPKAISEPVNQGRSGYVFLVLERKDASMDGFAAERDSIRDQLLEQKRSQVFETFAANAREQLQKEGKVKINDAEMKRLTAFGRG